MFDAQGWTVIITGTIAAVVAALPGIATFLLALRNKDNSEKLDALHAHADSMEGKLDTVKSQGDGVTEKLVAVTARSSFQEGVSAQKVAQNAAEGQERRASDSTTTTTGVSNMTLSQKQQVFTLNVAKLIIWAYQQGYGLTWGEAYRTAAQAELDVQAGTGILNTLHARRLAVDLNLFKGDMYYQSTDAYKPLGDYWKTLDPLNCWGGDFKPRADGNHFSMADGGQK